MKERQTNRPRSGAAPESAKCSAGHRIDEVTVEYGHGPMPGTRPSSYRPASSSHRLRTAPPQGGGGQHKRQPCYNFVSADDVSTIYNTVASELWRRSFWREVPPRRRRDGGLVPEAACYRECDLILAQCHGRGAPFDEIGGAGRVQVINYLQGSKAMTLKVELAMLLREWLEAHPDQGPAVTAARARAARPCARVRAGQERQENAVCDGALPPRCLSRTGPPRLPRCVHVCCRLCGSPSACPRADGQNGLSPPGPCDP